MGGRLQHAWKGKPVKNSPGGFPLYSASRLPRIITSNVWSYLQHLAAKRLPKAIETEAIAFLEQAFEFFEAASNPLLGSRPLLYYYSFLNLAKMALLIKGIRLPTRTKHGISDPRANKRYRLRLSGQVILAEKCTNDHSQVFPELVRILGGNLTGQRKYNIINLLSQIPGIHRTFCNVTGDKSKFLPIKGFSLLRDNNEIWVILIISKNNREVLGTLPLIRKQRDFRNNFVQVNPCDPKHSDEIWFQTGVINGRKRAIDKALKNLSEVVCEVGLWTILTADGSRFYLSTIPPRDRLPGLASIYAVMFYLGSLTRYKPYDFDKIITQKYAWLIGEFLKTQPTQFLYGLASHAGGTEVVKPFGDIS